MWVRISRWRRERFWVGKRGGCSEVLRKKGFEEAGEVEVVVEVEGDESLLFKGRARGRG